MLESGNEVIKTIKKAQNERENEKDNRKGCGITWSGIVRTGKKNAINREGWGGDLVCDGDGP